MNPAAISFSRPSLQTCYRSGLVASANLPADLRQVSALLELHDAVRTMEGPHSAGVHEIIDILISPRMRPELRCWYRHFGAELDHPAVAVRDHLNHLVGEKLQASEFQAQVPG